MLIDTGKLLDIARKEGFAVGAFNIYNLEGALAVVQAAESMSSPVTLQLLPSAMDIGGSPLIAMCLELAKTSRVPVSVHLDHCSDPERIGFALDAGISSVMADGSALNYGDNVVFTRAMVKMASATGRTVEAELGKISGEEDGLSVAAWEARMTKPDQAAEFVQETGVAALAVCIGNVHGKYRQVPNLDFSRLAAIAKVVSVPLVLHGTSGLPDEMITESIRHGVCKFNVNTEIRTAYIGALKAGFTDSDSPELVRLIRNSIEVMKDVVKSKITLFCSADKALTIINNTNSYN